MIYDIHCFSSSGRRLRALTPPSSKAGLTSAHSTFRYWESHLNRANRHSQPCGPCSAPKLECRSIWRAAPEPKVDSLERGAFFPKCGVRELQKSTSSRLT